MPVTFVERHTFVLRTGTGTSRIKSLGFTGPVSCVFMTLPGLVFRMQRFELLGRWHQVKVGRNVRASKTLLDDWWPEASILLWARSPWQQHTGFSPHAPLRAEGFQSHGWTTTTARLIHCWPNAKPVRQALPDSRYSSWTWASHQLWICKYENKREQC